MYSAPCPLSPIPWSLPHVHTPVNPTYMACAWQVFQAHTLVVGVEAAQHTAPCSVAASEPHCGCWLGLFNYPQGIDVQVAQQGTGLPPLLDDIDQMLQQSQPDRPLDLLPLSPLTVGAVCAFWTGPR